MFKLVKLKKKLSQIPIIGFAAYSGTGKTTLLEKLIPIFKKHNFRIAIIKHAHHDFDIDQPGKDSFKLRKAGSVDTIVASKYRWAHIHENIDELQEPMLSKLIENLDAEEIDLIMVEGFKHEAIPRIELRRSTLNKPLLYPNDNEIIAIASDDDDKISHPIDVLNIDEPYSIFEYILKTFSFSTKIL